MDANTQAPVANGAFSIYALYTYVYKSYILNK